MPVHLWKPEKRLASMPMKKGFHVRYRDTDPRNYLPASMATRRKAQHFYKPVLTLKPRQHVV